MPIRLVEGTGPYEGRLEVYIEGKWGTVADPLHFSQKEAKAVCRQLGFPGLAVATRSSVFGMGSGHIALRHIYCSDYRTDFIPSTIDDCHLITRNIEFARHEHDVGVVCNSKFLLHSKSSIPSVNSWAYYTVRTFRFPSLSTSLC